MEDMKGSCSSKSGSEELDEMELDMELRRGPWTVEEDLTLINYIASHGEGRWNSLARFAGLKRTGKSCRLRWLNYLRPDVRRGNITLEEQLLILELHSRWGNRWSKIAQHLPGRTDNEIKNYWRTRVQKHAKQLKCDVNSKQFKDTMRYLWMPRLVERIQAASASGSADSTSSTTTITHQQHQQHMSNLAAQPEFTCNSGYTPENSSTAASSDSFGAQVSPISDQADYYIPARHNPSPDSYFQTPAGGGQFSYSETLISPSAAYYNQGLDIPEMEQNNYNPWVDQGHTTDSLWNVDDDFLFLQQQFNYSNI